MKSHYSKIIVLPCLLALSALLFSGCNDKISYVPVFKSISLSPDTVSPGGFSELMVEVTDADDEDLVYSYATTGGSILGYGDTVTWQAPDHDGVFSVQVSATDQDGNQATDSINLVVKRLATSTIITGIAAFTDSTNFDLADAKVFLFNTLEDWENHIAAYSTKANGFGPIVSFRFDNVPAGSYYLDVWKDMDFGNTRNIGDFTGWYGIGTISAPTPKPFALESGGTIYTQIQMWVMPGK